MNPPVKALFPIFLLLAGISVGHAQSGGPWSIKSSTLDGGGARSSGGTWTLTGTIGQADAAAKANGGSFVVQGGSWPGVIAAPGGPKLTIAKAGPANFSIAWAADAAGYTLQYSTNLTLWADHPVAITGASSVSWPGSEGPRYFFRLKKP